MIRGGALYSDLYSNFSLYQTACLHFQDNQYGGAIYAVDVPGPGQFLSQQHVALRRKCFFHILGNEKSLQVETTPLVFVNNSAGVRGTVLYGGLLEKCNFTSDRYTTTLKLFNLSILYSKNYNALFIQPPACTFAYWILTLASHLNFWQEVTKSKCNKLDSHIKTVKNWILQLSTHYFRHWKVNVVSNQIFKHSNLKIEGYIQSILKNWVLKLYLTQTHWKLNILINNQKFNRKLNVTFNNQFFATNKLKIECCVNYHFFKMRSLKIQFSSEKLNVATKIHFSKPNILSWFLSNIIHADQWMMIRLHSNKLWSLHYALYFLYMRFY